MANQKFIDLGLSVKWASCNVGASSPEDYGGYYAWGETEEKNEYSWETYKWCNGSDDTLTKYRTNSKYGTVDNKTVLEPEDDVAHVKWGGGWRMPTFKEQQELLDKCSWAWTTLNGIKGYKVTGPNGNSIFLPAAGYRSGAEVYGRGTIGNYWSASLGDGCSYDAYYLYFNSSYHDWLYYYRASGHSVRPVQSPQSDNQNNTGSNIRTRIGSQLRALREANGLSTRELAAASGLSHSHIVRIESGRYGITVDTLNAICKVLGAKIKITSND